MELWHAAVLGLVEGITEYLPISSTGHLILASALMGLDKAPDQKAAIDAFNIVIQGGAILAVLGLYWPRVLQMIKGVFGQDKAGLKLAINIVIAFVPAAVLGVMFDDLIDAHLFSTWPVLGALALGGVYMMLLDRWKIHPHRADAENATGKDITDLTWRDALIIGFLQCVAMWPGTSRSMMTITGGVLVGLKPRQAAEFSFLLGLPTLGGACVYKLYKNMTGEGPNMFETLGTLPIVIGIAVATVSAALAVRWLVNFLNKHGLAPFGWYRLALTALLGGLVLAGLVQIG
ncbi:MAG: undecaprenyl-diphosphate phosphatase [Phycisphaeraceae bacterium]|nr:MAG: undecaprenyl-diphosphate phosphatase [Phycisphaeraceae bacterium]